jgi:hypothetical protein
MSQLEGHCSYTLSRDKEKFLRERRQRGYGFFTTETRRTLRTEGVDFFSQRPALVVSSFSVSSVPPW